ncbi:MAG: HEAT repeat domain-containing protein [Planctomycetes bacterium]|nr:HEAT repeat domain-containing protein [Planctomycetota bacterium]
MLSAEPEVTGVDTTAGTPAPAPPDLDELLRASPSAFLRRVDSDRALFDRAQEELFGRPPDPDLVRALLDLATEDPAAARAVAMLPLPEQDLAELLDLLPAAPATLSAALLAGLRVQPENLDRGSERLAAILCARGGDAEATATLAELLPRLAVRGSGLVVPVAGALRAASGDASEEVRRIVARGLGGRPAEEAEYLAAWYRREASSAVRLELLRPLAGSRTALRSALTSDPDPAVRRLAAELSRLTLVPEDRPWLESVAANESDPEVKRALVETLDLPDKE